MKRRYEIVKHAQRIKRHHRAARLTIVIFSLLLFLVGAVLVFRSARWVVVEVVVDGNKTIPAAEIAAAAKTELVGNYWWIFPKANILWYPKNAVQEKLLTRFSNLASVELRLLNLNTVAVSVEERRGKFVWCSLVEEQSCYFSDDTGLIFAPALRLTGNVFLEFAGALPANPIGQRPLPEAKFRTIVRLADELGNWLDSSVAIARVFLADHDDFEFQLRNPVQGSDRRVLRLLFDINQDLSGALINLRSAFTAEELQKIFRSDPLTLDYIDLRFPPKVFYKIRQ